MSRARQMRAQPLGILIGSAAIIQVAAANDGPLRGYFTQFQIREA